MKRIKVVMLHEIITQVSRKSFWIITMGVPIMAALVLILVNAINRDARVSEAVAGIINNPVETRPEGFVDPGGLIKSIPEGFPQGMFQQYPDESSAVEALEVGDISAYFLLPADYIDKGKIYYIAQKFNLLESGSENSGTFNWLVDFNLLDGNGNLASLVNGPYKVNNISLAPADVPEVDENNTLAYWLPYAVAFLFYMIIIITSSLLLSNVSKEKENRVIEILLNSVTPTQLMTGKIIGLGLTSLLQVAILLVSGYFAVNLSGNAISLPPGFELPPSIIAWGIVFFLLGYSVYASLMAGVGALAPNMREGSQLTIVVMLPLIAPLFFSSTVFMNEPNGTFATVFSLFPLSTPVAMMSRLAAGGVPWWQPPLAAVLLALTAVLVVKSVAGMFRAQTLLSGQPIKLKTFLRALIGK
jgi:ABC-2 type transport system permease protein